MGSVLLVDLQDSRVFLIGRGKNSRGFTGQKNRRVRPFSIIHSPDQKHGPNEAKVARSASAGPRLHLGSDTSFWRPCVPR